MTTSTGRASAAHATWLAAALGLALSASCSDEAHPNVILISVDTLRADALGASGGALATPNLDALAREGIVYATAYAPSAATAPSHATLLTGQEILTHGVVKNGAALAADAGTLAEAFAARGYDTAAFVSSFVLDGRFGWNQGFAHFDDEFPEAGATLPKDSGPDDLFWKEHEFGGFDRRGRSTTDAVRAWLATAHEPFFLWVHYFDPHAPYSAPRDLAAGIDPELFDLTARSLPGATPEMLRRAIAEYHAEVLYTDREVGRLLESVRARTAGSKTLTVVTSDHGEGLGQHQWLEHSITLYDELVRVPLVVHGTGHAPARWTTPVGLRDVAPTLCELAGVGPLAAADGRSLAPALRAGTEPEARPLFGYRRRMPAQPPAHQPELHSIRADRWKYVRNPLGPELYDLDVDPGELHNRFADETDLALGLERRIEAWIDASPEHGEAEELPEDVRRGLEALGYVGED